jgi:hypothetical protein
MRLVMLAALLLAATILAVRVEAADPVVVVQETRTPGGTKQRPSVQHVVLLKNVSAASVHRLRVTVEFYDFFGKILWARTAVPMPASLGPGDTATLSLSTPRLESMSRTRYRFEYAGGSDSPRGRAR